MKRILNFDYCLINSTYWMFYAVAAIYTSVYLLDLGYSNTVIGTVIAMGNIIAMLCQVLIANITDKNENITNMGLLKVFIAVLLVFTIVVYLTGKMCIVVTLGYTIIIVIHTAMHPFVNSLSHDLESCGVHVSYGIARAMGSLWAGIWCTAIGYIITARGASSLLSTGIAIIVLIYLSLLITGIHYKRYSAKPGILEISATATETAATETAAPEAASTISMTEFIKRNKLFLVVGFGFVLIFFGNVIIENFMYQIIDNIGEDISVMGPLTGVGAMLEVPPMLVFDRLSRKIDYKTLLKFCTVFFLVKIIMITWATNITMIYIAQLNQMLGYGLAFPTMVAFIDHVMDEAEAVRGQTIFTAAITAGQVVGMVFGGMLFDAIGVKATMEVATLLTAIGALLVWLVAGKIRRHQVSTSADA